MWLPEMVAGLALDAPLSTVNTYYSYIFPHKIQRKHKDNNLKIQLNLDDQPSRRLPVKSHL